MLNPWGAAHEIFTVVSPVRGQADRTGALFPRARGAHDRLSRLCVRRGRAGPGSSSPASTAPAATMTPR